jgi:hypothetical protein
MVTQNVVAWKKAATNWQPVGYSGVKHRIATPWQSSTIAPKRRITMAPLM